MQVFTRLGMVLATFAALLLALTPPATAEEVPPGVPAETTLLPGESFATEIDGVVYEAELSDPLIIKDGGGGIQPYALPPAYCTDWKQTTTYTAYKVVNKGRFCWNGRNVWLNNPNYPKHDGWHKCLTAWTIGYDVTHKCDEKKGVRDSDGAVYMNFTDDYEACFITKYGFLCVSNWMRARGWEGGGVTYAWD